MKTADGVAGVHREQDQRAEDDDLAATKFAGLGDAGHGRRDPAGDSEGDGDDFARVKTLAAHEIADEQRDHRDARADDRDRHRVGVILRGDQQSRRNRQDHAAEEERVAPVDPLQLARAAAHKNQDHEGGSADRHARRRQWHRVPVFKQQRGGRKGSRPQKHAERRDQVADNQLAAARRLVRH